VCGIAGKVSPAEPVDPGLLERMCAVLEHRGPDAQGTFCADGAGLGIRRLAVIDLETGDQPVTNEDGSVVVVLNGEIYNFRELRARLRSGGHRLATQGDSEVIAHLYEDHGDAVVDHLRGMFAFALWDRRRRRLLLARDRVGKKPLLYAERGGRLWFGSEARALLQDPEVPRDPDLDAIDAFLHLGYVPDPQSAFAALRKLPPAHRLVWQDGRTRVERWWRLDYEPERPFASREELSEALRDKLREAVRLRLRSDVPLGALLSGGVDSSAVVAAMVRESGRPVRTFALGFDAEGFDEAPHARAVAEHLGTEHTEARVAPDALGLLPDIVWHHGEPFADSSAIPTFQLCRLVAGEVTVALNGDGGDEAFAGYNRYRGLLAAERLARVVPRAPAGMLAALAARIDPGPRTDTRRARVRRLGRALALDPAGRHAMWVAAFDEDERADLLTPELRAAISGARSGPAVLRDAYATSAARDPLDRLLDADARVYLPGDLLAKVDIASMAYGLELRSPLLDHELLELVARLPARDKLDGRVAKRALKDAVAPWLPPGILDRPKSGFRVPIREWFRGPLRDLPAEILLDPRATGRGWLRTDRVVALIRAHHEHRRDASAQLWALIQLELWLRTYVEGAAPAPVALDLAVA
jgi:asparagine synthase (glutamine-hydrolysing)